MQQYVRKKVIRFELRDNDSTDPMSRKLWPHCSSAVLECGHIHNLGNGSNYRPKSMACWLCGTRKKR